MWKEITLFRLNSYKKFKERDVNFFSGRSVIELQQFGNSLIFKRCKENEKTLEKLSSLLHMCGPLIVGENGIGHLMVLKGIVNNNIIIHDPWSGPNLTFSLEEFKKIWDGRVLYFLNGYSKYLEKTLIDKPANSDRINSTRNG